MVNFKCLFLFTVVLLCTTEFVVADYNTTMAASFCAAITPFSKIAGVTCAVVNGVLSMGSKSHRTKLNLMFIKSNTCQNIQLNPGGRYEVCASKGQRLFYGPGDRVRINGCYQIGIGKESQECCKVSPNNNGPVEVYKVGRFCSGKKEDHLTCARDHGSMADSCHIAGLLYENYCVKGNASYDFCKRLDAQYMESC